MATKKSTAVVKPDDTPVAVVGDQLPDFMKKGKVRGIETLNSGDFLVPSLYMLQKQNPEVDQGFQAGKLYHNILEKTLEDTEGENLLSFVPIMVRIEYTLWNPRHLGGGMLAKASDGVHWDKPGLEVQIKVGKKDPYIETWKIGTKVEDLTMKPGEDGKPTLSVGNFGSSDIRVEDSAPAATKAYVVLAMSPTHMDLGPFVLRFQKTSEGVARKMNQRIRTAGVDSFGQVFKLGTEFIDKGEEEQYYRYLTKAAGFVQDEVMFAEFERQYKLFAALDSWNIKEAEPVEPGDVIDGEAQEVTSADL